MVNKQEFIIEKVNIYELSHTKLLKFTKQLHESYEKEKYSRKYNEVDRDWTDVFLKIDKDKLNKFMFDVTEIHKTVDDSTRELNDLKNRLRVQNTKFTVENVENVNRLRLENQNSVRVLTTNFKNQTRQLIELNSTFQDMIENGYLQQRNLMKNTELEYITRTNDNALQMETHVTQVLEKLNEERIESFGRHNYDKRQFLEKLQSENDKNTNYTIDLYTDEMDKLNTSWATRNRHQAVEIDRLKAKHEKVKYKKQVLAQRVQDFSKENENLVAVSQTNAKRNVYLEHKLVNYDNCQKLVDKCLKQIKTFKSLLQVKSGEIELLERENADMKKALKKYKECLVDVIIDLKEQYYLNDKKQPAAIENKLPNSKST